MTTNTAKSMLNCARGILLIYYRVIIHIYAVFIVFHLALDFVVGERWLLIAFLNTFAHLIWLPAIALSLLNLSLRRWRLSAMLFPAILAFLLAWGSMFLPKHSIEARITDTPIRILTFNLKGYNRRQDAIVELIREVNADIVALQELSHINSPHIEVELQDIYPYKALHQTDNVTQGQGILSRYPITDDTFWRYDFAANMLGHQRVEITLENNRSIVLYNVHPSHPAMQGSFFDPQYRSLEIAAILQDSSKESWPQLLLGDFNMPELSDDYAQIRSHYKDAYRDSGFGMGWTFPDGGFISPFMRLDYIFYSDDFVAQHAQVWKSSAGSDHRPLFVDILLLNS